MFHLNQAFVMTHILRALPSTMQVMVLRSAFSFMYQGRHFRAKQPLTRFIKTAQAAQARGNFSQQQYAPVDLRPAWQVSGNNTLLQPK